MSAARERCLYPACESFTDRHPWDRVVEVTVILWGRLWPTQAAGLLLASAVGVACDALSRRTGPDRSVSDGLRTVGADRTSRERVVGGDNEAVLGALADAAPLVWWFSPAVALPALAARASLTVMLRGGWRPDRVLVAAAMVAAVPAGLAVQGLPDPERIVVLVVSSSLAAPSVAAILWPRSAGRTRGFHGEFAGREVSALVGWWFLVGLLVGPAFGVVLQTVSLHHGSIGSRESLAAAAVAAGMGTLVSLPTKLSSVASAVAALFGATPVAAALLAGGGSPGILKMALGNEGSMKRLALSAAVVWSSSFACAVIVVAASSGF